MAELQKLRNTLSRLARFHQELPTIWSTSTICLCINYSLYKGCEFIVCLLNSSGASFDDYDSIPRDGRLLWKISLVLDAPVQQSSASFSTPRSYRSPSFYTANIGYKVHLVLEIHASRDQPSSADGEHFDTPATSLRSTGTSSDLSYARRGFEPHCSIFIRLEPGRFDDSLRFPLDGSLTVTLINQVRHGPVMHI